jgi:uncharacterized protein YdhG (YjbR/CyaY superfamily)
VTTRKRPTTIAEYIETAPRAGQPYLRRIYAIVTRVALAPETSAALSEDLAKHPATKNTLQVPYDEPLPEGLIRKIVKHRLKVLRERKDESFW